MKYLEKQIKKLHAISNDVAECLSVSCSTCCLPKENGVCVLLGPERCAGPAKRQQAAKKLLAEIIFK